MANEAMLQAKSQVDTPVDSDLRCMLDGALVVADRIDSYIARGYGWHCTVGAFSTGILGGGSASVVDSDQPELSIDIPDGYTTMPVRISVQAPASAVSSADDEEQDIIIGVDRTQISGSVAADGTVESPLNFRTDKIGGCPNDVVSYVLNTANTENARSFELAHSAQVMDYAGTPATSLWNESALLYEPAVPPMIVGPANISVWFGGTIEVTGFIQAVWVTIPTSDIEDLV